MYMLSTNSEIDNFDDIFEVKTTKLYLTNIWTNYELFIARLSDVKHHNLSYYQNMRDIKNRHYGLVSILLIDFLYSDKFNSIFDYTEKGLQNILRTLSIAIYESKTANNSALIHSITNTVLIKLMYNSGFCSPIIEEHLNIENQNYVDFFNLLDMAYDDTTVDENVKFGDTFNHNLYEIRDSANNLIDEGDVVFIKDKAVYAKIHQILCDYDDLDVFTIDNSQVVGLIVDTIIDPQTVMSKPKSQEENQRKFLTFNIDVELCPRVNGNMFQLRVFG